MSDTVTPETMAGRVRYLCKAFADEMEYCYFPMRAPLRCVRAIAISRVLSLVSSVPGLKDSVSPETCAALRREMLAPLRVIRYGGPLPPHETALLDECDRGIPTRERFIALILDPAYRLNYLGSRDDLNELSQAIEDAAARLSCWEANDMTEEEFLKAKREAREKRFNERREARLRDEALAKDITDLKPGDIAYFDDIPRLQQILRESDNDDTVKAALDRVYHLRIDDDIDIVRACLPGRCTWTLLSFLCREEKESPYRYITMNHLVRAVVPGLQREGRYAAEALLDSFYQRKYHHYVNREKDGDLDYWRALEQFDAAQTPEEAFRNIDPYLYDKWYEPDDSDEFSYISTMDEKPFSIGGYNLHSWRMKCLREADLLLPDD